jgi:hypothetical protein
MWSRARVQPLESNLHPYITLISRSVQILPSQLRLSLKWVFLSGFPTKNLYVILISNIHTTHPVHLVFHDGIISIIFGEEHTLWSSSVNSFLQPRHFIHIKSIYSYYPRHSVLEQSQSMFFPSGRVYEPMARVSKVAREKIFLAGGIHCCPNNFPDKPCYIMNNINEKE